MVLKPILTTTRTYLREFTELDLDELAPIFADPEVMIFSVIGVLNRNEVQNLLADWIKRYRTNILAPWAIVYQDQIIGYAGLPLLPVEGKEKIQITFRLMPRYRGKGLATEIAEALKDYAFSKLNLNGFVGIVDHNNIASVSILKKLGMIYKKPVDYHGFALHEYQITGVTNIIN